MATSYKSFLGGKDVKWWDGLTRTFARLTSTGGTLTQNKIGDYVDVLEVYGGGTNYNATTLNDAIHALSSISGAVLRLKPGVWLLDANVTVPTNLTLDCPHGVIISQGGAFTLVSNGPFSAGLYQVFSGFSAGDVTFGSGAVKEAYPEWWGAKGDGVTDDSAALQSWANVGGNLFAPAGTYIVNGYIQQFPSRSSIHGAGIGKTIFKMKDHYWNRMFYVHEVDHVKFSDLTIDGNSSNYVSADAATSGYDNSYISGLLFQDCFDCTVDGIEIINWPAGIPLGFRKSTGGARNKAINCLIKNSGKLFDSNHPSLWNCTAIDMSTDDSIVSNNTIINVTDTAITVGEDGPQGCTISGNTYEFNWGLGYKDPGPGGIYTGSSIGIGIGGNMALYETSHHVITGNVIRSSVSEPLRAGITVGNPNATSGMISAGNYNISDNVIDNAQVGLNIFPTFESCVISSNTFKNITLGNHVGINFEFGSECYPHKINGNSFYSVTTPFAIQGGQVDQTYSSPAYYGFKAIIENNDNYDSNSLFPRKNLNILKEGSFDTITNWTLGSQFTNPAATDFGGSKVLLYTGNAGGPHIASQPVGNKIPNGWITLVMYIKVVNVTAGTMFVDLNGTAYGQTFINTDATHYGWSNLNNKGWLKLTVWLNIQNAASDAAFRIVESGISSGGTISMKFAQISDGIDNRLLYSQSLP